MKKVVTAGGLSRLVEKAGKYHWGIISAWVGDEVYEDAVHWGYENTHKQYNKEKTEELLNDIRSLGLLYETLTRVYRYPNGEIDRELSYIVWDYTGEEISHLIHALAVKYNQFGYVYGVPSGQFVDRSGKLLSKVVYAETDRLDGNYKEVVNTNISFNKVFRDYGAILTGETMLRGGATFRLSASYEDDKEYLAKLPRKNYGWLRAMGFYQAREQARKKFLEQN